MQIPGLPSLLFLFYLLVYLPWMAARSRRLFVAQQAARERMAGLPPAARTALGKPPPSRLQIWAHTLISQVVLLGFAAMVGRSFGYPVDERLGELEVSWPAGAALAVAALGACLLVRWLLRRWHRPEERERLAVFALAPRRGAEQAMRLAAVLVASVAEELAYRGVLTAILGYSFGSFFLGALLSALAFALSHALQGGKSMAAIFVFGALMQLLAAATGSLLLPMLVHAAYDLIAGFFIAREAKRRDIFTAPA